MADKSSRDGASGLGWFIIGLLIGVAGTIATQKFAVFKNSEAASDASVAAVQPPAPATPASPPKLLVHQGGLAAPSAAPVAATPTPNTTGQTAADVADDAAATGMTARPRPQQPLGN
jgi:hypothetical protein